MWDLIYHDFYIHICFMKIVYNNFWVMDTVYPILYSGSKVKAEKKFQLLPTFLPKYLSPTSIQRCAPLWSPVFSSHYDNLGWAQWKQWKLLAPDTVSSE